MSEDGRKRNNERGVVRRAASAAGRATKFALIGDTREVTMLAAAMRERLRRLLRPGDYARRETFAEACERLGVSSEDVERRRDELQSSARLYLGIAIVALVVFGFLPWSQHRVSHGLSSLLVLGMALARYSVVRWRQAQCSMRELMPYVQYWRRWWGI